MQLLFSTDLALRTLIRLSAEPERHLSTELLARELCVSRHHLQKVVQSLTDAGFLRTIRGVKGGVMLAKPPDDIRVGEVARHQEREQAIAECFLQPSRQAHASRLHDVCERRSGPRRGVSFRQLAGVLSPFYRVQNAPPLL